MREKRIRVCVCVCPSRSRRRGLIYMDICRVRGRVRELRERARAYGDDEGRDGQRGWSIRPWGRDSRVGGLHLTHSYYFSLSRLLSHSSCGRFCLRCAARAATLRSSHTRFPLAFNLPNIHGIGCTYTGGVPSAAVAATAAADYYHYYYYYYYRPLPNRVLTLGLIKAQRAHPTSCTILTRAKARFSLFPFPPFFFFSIFCFTFAAFSYFLFHALSGSLSKLFYLFALFFH